jgi:hypothetical protein
LIDHNIKIASVLIDAIDCCEQSHRNNLKHTQMKEKECPECEGLGTVEAFKDCGRPASDCCGGCTITIECEACQGSGTINTEEDDE